MRNIILTLMLSVVSSVFADKIGQWQTYIGYSDITDIEPAGNLVYVLSSDNIFSYNTVDKSVATYDTVYPLNDSGIQYIAWCNGAKRLVIIYTDHNIDLLDNNSNVVNISDYYDKSMTEDKTVNNITINGNYAYLSTGFGIVKINVKDAEISDTYNLKMNVTDCAIENNTIYAKTPSGVYAGKISDNLIDKNNWKITSTSVSFNDANDIIVSTNNGYKEYIAYDNTNKCYWSNQQDGKLQGYKLDNDNGTKTFIAQDINPDGPKYNYFGFLKIHDNKLYSCNGSGWDMKQPASIQILDLNNNSWTTFNNEGIGDKYGVRYQDIISLDIDPRDNRHIVAGSQAGLFEFYDGEVTNHWNHENSPIYSHYNVSDKNVNYEIITSVLYDKNGNLFLANTGSSKNTLLRLNSDNTWSTLSNSISGENGGFLKFKEMNDKGQIWMCNNDWNYPAVYLYDTMTDAVNEYSNFVNEDGITFNNVSGCRTLAKDKEGNIWIGIDQALLMLPPEYQNDPSLGFYQIKVPRNDGTNLADYLLSGLDITAIAVDNANRKWIGTNNNGLYVVSNDNIVEEHHFTTSNSSILSNVIQSIIIDNKTGKVFIGTDKGLCSYQSEASETNEDMNKDNVWAYPNPVRPEYRGMITITGLSFNADVKITTSNGVLVAQGRSTGGSFLWDGNDLKGKRVASGIYMVQTATSDGSKGTVCKIAIIK